MQNFIVNFSDCSVRNPSPGVEMHTFEGQYMTLSIVDMEAEAVVPEHSHPHEQVGYMVRGGGTFRIAGHSYPVAEGQMWRIPGGVAHEVIAGTTGLRAIDVFYPVREDMRPQ